ncbi:MAG: hypothetical protein M1281_03395 [Chloroflexi bacterium]|nr:hypothetical protein [Chloroflexota bacterium]
MTLDLNSNRTKAVLLLILSLAAGAGLQRLSGQGQFWIGTLACALLLFLSGLLCLAAWAWAGHGRGLAWMILLAFTLRLGLGVSLEYILPVAGYHEAAQKAGYIATDAFSRDNQAWQLAQSGKPLWVAFGPEYPSDQYGGMLSLSALIYRALSPDVHRPYLILILTAAAAALGLPFFWKAVLPRWGKGIALAGGWILALYPESVFWGAGQMREPFLISLVAVTFWAALQFPVNRKVSLAGLGLSLLGLVFFSPLIAGAIVGVLTVWGYIEALAGVKSRSVRMLGWVLLLAGAIAAAWVGWAWLQPRVAWDAGLTEDTSGFMQKIIRGLGPGSQIPVVTAYGMARPVLPAAATDWNAILLWRLLNSWRALGWYALAPLLIYGTVAAWNIRDAGERRLLVWLAVALWVWTVISSARGGGDASDNPRYRVILLPWFALIAAWAGNWALAHRKRWLVRILAVEGIFLLFFTQWYLSRNYRWFPHLDIYLMLGLVAGLGALVIVGGWLWDWRGARSALTRPREGL